jgi:Zn-dependent protease with chaperone function
MGATLWCDKIYISKDLSVRLSPRERRVLLAHELAHYYAKDRLRIAGVSGGLAVFICWLFSIQSYIPAVAMILMFGILVNAYCRHREIIADKKALAVTRDPQAFLSLMAKLEHGGKRHPSIDYRNNLAKEYEYYEYN